MTEKEFFDTFITERMQMHYFGEHPGLTDDGVFFYLKGGKDRLLLYRTSEKL